MGHETLACLMRFQQGLQRTVCPQGKRAVSIRFSAHTTQTGCFCSDEAAGVVGCGGGGGASGFSGDVESGRYWMDV